MYEYVWLVYSHVILADASTIIKHLGVKDAEEAKKVVNELIKGLYYLSTVICVYVFI